MVWQKLEGGERNERLIVAAWGLPKTGKTHFALTFPEPIYYFNLDWGFEYHKPRLAGRDIYVADFLSLQPELPGPEAEAMLRRFEQDYHAALKEGAGTVVVDTSTQLWQLASSVFLEEIKKKRRDGNIYPFDYAKANAYFQNLINQVKSTNMNMVLIQRAREKHNQQGQPTGTYEMQGNNQVPYLVGIQLHMTKQGEGEGTEHFGLIESCWASSKLEGTNIKDPTFSKLRALVNSVG